MTTRKPAGPATRGRTTRGTASDANGATPRTTATKAASPAKAPAKAAAATPVEAPVTAETSPLQSTTSESTGAADTAATEAAAATKAATDTAVAQTAEVTEAMTETAADIVDATTDATETAASTATEMAKTTTEIARTATHTTGKTQAELMEEVAASAAATTAADVAAEALRTATSIAERSAAAAMEVFDGMQKSMSAEMITDPAAAFAEAQRMRDEAMSGLVDASNEAAKAFGDATDGLVSFTQARIDFGINTAREAMSAQSFEEMAAVQERYTRGLVDLYVEHAAKLSEVGLRLAGAALSPMNRHWQKTFVLPGSRPRA
ncbi:hypothetical protein GCM10011505_08730 [Tistrella bauzanensis]|uniref:Phasin domain-containing protein n=1 Tax=Tistrella bauzanensis TaxID=657419 RepID=A0ABQ1I9B7_9PROT|nr:phasin family protein [Tistrella bauzanensis]GGB29633.1 hypothetical protein GCM10011505_08730 [Tistrella bauzanensis]